MVCSGLVMSWFCILLSWYCMICFWSCFGLVLVFACSGLGLVLIYSGLTNGISMLWSLSYLDISMIWPWPCLGPGIGIPWSWFCFSLVMVWSWSYFLSYYAFILVFVCCGIGMLWSELWGWYVLVFFLVCFGLVYYGIGYVSALVCSGVGLSLNKKLRNTLWWLTSLLAVLIFHFLSGYKPQASITKHR